MTLAIYYHPELKIACHTTADKSGMIREKLVKEGFIRLSEFKGYDISPIHSRSATDVLHYINDLRKAIQETERGFAT
jgi:hypothetical protein